MKLGIRGHDLGVKGEFNLTERLNEFGFDGVQLVPYKTFGDIKYSPEITLDRAKQISCELENNNKKVFLLGSYFNPVHSVKEKVENGINTFKRYIELASVFKTMVVGSETGSYNDDKWTYNPLNRLDEALEKVIKTFSELCEYALEKGCFVGIEGAAGHVAYSVERLKQAVDAINKPNLKVIFDIYNYLDDSNYNNYLEILENGLKTFKGKIHCFHMKDCQIIDGKLKQCAIGKGLFNYEKIIALIKENEPEARLILEGTTGDDIRPSCEFIRKIWAN